MKYHKFLTIVLFCTLTTAWGVNNPNVQSPVGSPTTVPSTTRSSLIPNRPIQTSGSADVVTGNVGGLKYFHGVLPYGSNYYTNTTSYSPVDNFLRRSYDPILHDRSPGITRPYYNPRRTFTSMSSVRADGTGLFTPTVPSQGTSDPYVPPMLAQTVDTQYRQRPLSLSGSELERLMNRQMQLRQEAEQQKEELAKEKDTAVIEDIRTESPFFQDYLRPEEMTPERKPLEPTEPETPAMPDESLPEQKPLDTTEPDRLPEEQVLEAVREEQRKNLMEDPTERTVELLNPSLKETEEAEPTEQTPEEAARQAADKERASAMLRRYGSYEKLAKARTDNYIAAAEAFLHDGKFYKAADAFALAGIWSPEEVRPSVGQAISLFAAGEYMSSAYLLRQAIMKNPNVASAKIDIAALMKDRDVFENRLIEMSTWQQRNGSGELAFLIAYILQHDGKTPAAKEAITAAAEKMPDDPAVQTLRTVIQPETAK